HVSDARCLSKGELQDAVSDVAKHAIVFDAGSNKTKVEIYKINVASPLLDLTDIQQLDPSLSKVEPGIASLAGNPNGVAAYLTPLLGGASHQNTFDNPTKDTFPITLGGQQYHLFARSYLGYGATEARKKCLEAILLNQTTSNEISSPCHHKGYEEVITIGNQRVKVKGSALVPLCPSIIEETFFCKRPNCPFYDQPRLQGDFGGFSGIFYTALGTGMLCYKCTKSLSPAMFEVSSRNFCARRFQDVNSDPYAKVNCFQSNFVYELLAKGYRLPADKTIEVGKKIGGFSLGWSLGAMLYNGKYLYNTHIAFSGLPIETA
ncbi:ectonucleoside triphosphate diphosphohydrolase 3-like, partial [Montipora capricornis]|uniref:ectonucleoside triphosphate diphosphohydrolase 3-like n=1 Tax=Montipora capricornis TaxID=246305 RepID=UPI0035F1438E